LTDYCGGTFSGIISKLDYIQGLGVNAIWISPIPAQTDKGFHGYWQKDITKINPHFGSEQDLKNLVDECHKRDIWVMLDVYVAINQYCTLLKHVIAHTENLTQWSYQFYLKFCFLVLFI